MSSIPNDHESDLVLEAAGIGAWRWCQSTGKVYLSALARQLISASSDVIDYQAFAAAFRLDGADSAEALLSAELTASGHIDFYAQVVPLVGPPLWLRVLGRHSGEGGNFAVRGALMDATRVKAESEAHRQMALIVISSGDAIVATTLSGKITAFNPCAETLYGYAAAEAIGHSTVMLLVPPSRRDEMEAILDGIKQGKRVEHFETFAFRKDGTTIDVSMTVSPIWDAAGRLIGASQAARVITDEKLARVALAERWAHLQSVLDTSPDAMVVVDGHDVISWFSLTAERMFGRSAAEAIGQNVSILMPLRHEGLHDASLTPDPSAGGRSVIGESRVAVGLRKDGSVFPMELTVGRVGEGEQILFTGFMRDLTERQQSELRLEELQAELIHMSRYTELGAMASVLAHELNQPLTAVVNYLKAARRLWANRNADYFEMVEEAMERAASQALRAGEIIRRLRDMVSRGETELRLESPKVLIEEAAALVLPGGKQHGVQTHFDFHHGATMVVANRVQVQQVLLNLMRNAVEAMEDAPERNLTVTTRMVEEDDLQIEVADTGSGIASEVAEQLFRPFVSTKRHGLGVGLLISRTIIEAHGGKLWAEPRPGGGTAFRLTLKTSWGEDLAHVS